MCAITKIIYCAFITLVYVAHSQGRIDENALTFAWYENITAEKATISQFNKNPHPAIHLAERSDLYRKINGTLILQATNFSSEYPDSAAWIQYPGFVDAVFYSYRKHHNLIIRPDDIWTAIIVQFSLYVNANAEQLRHKFVKFEGKKELQVEFHTSIDHVPFDIFIEKIVTLINEHIDPSIFAWVTPNFTTTTENDKVTAGAALMATLQKYFDYTLSLIICGIPRVTILGSVNDWKEIRQRIDKLKDFELDGKDVMAKWSSMLGRIINQFISVKEGNEKDDVFWKQAIRVDYKIVRHGCSSSNETHLNGWITAFSAFDRSGNWQEKIDDFHEDYYRRFTGRPTRDSSPWLSIPTKKITPGMVQVPIKIYDQYADADEHNYSGAIITGHMGYTVSIDEKTIQPLSGWAMAITNKAPRYLRYKIDPVT